MGRPRKGPGADPPGPLLGQAASNGPPPASGWVPEAGVFSKFTKEFEENCIKRNMLALYSTYFKSYR